MIGQIRVPLMEQREAVWLDSHGDGTVKSFSVPGYTLGGAPYIEIVEGTVIAWNHGLQRWVPMAADKAVAAVVSGNTVEVTRTHQFNVGDRIFITDLGYRTITAISRGDQTLTFDGAAGNIALNAIIRHDSFRGYSTVDGTTGAQTVVKLASAAPFKTGDTVSIGADTGIVIADVDYDTNEITIPSTTVAPGELVVTEAAGSTGHYRITCETVRLSDLSRGYTSPNNLVPCREVGEVRERLVIGLTPEAKAYLKAMGVRFNNTAF